MNINLKLPVVNKSQANRNGEKIKFQQKPICLVPYSYNSLLHCGGLKLIRQERFFCEKVN